MLCYVMLCYVMLCYVMLYFFYLGVHSSKMATIEEAFDVVCKTFRISALMRRKKTELRK